MTIKNLTETSMKAALSEMDPSRETVVWLSVFGDVNLEPVAPGAYPAGFWAKHAGEVSTNLGPISPSLLGAQVLQGKEEEVRDLVNELRFQWAESTLKELKPTL